MVDAPLIPDPAGLVRVPCGPRVYFLRVPRLMDRPALAREIAAMGGRQHGPQAFLRSAIAGARALLDEGAARDAVVGQLEAQLARWAALADLARERDKADGADEGGARALLVEIDAAQAELAEIEAHIRQLWPPYATMLADNAAYSEIRAIALVRLFLAGWDGVGAEFPTLGRGQRVADALIELIPPADLDRIAAEAEALLAPSETQRGN